MQVNILVLVTVCHKRGAGSRGNVWTLSHVSESPVPGKQRREKSEQGQKTAVRNLLAGRLFYTDPKTYK